MGKEIVKKITLDPVKCIRQSKDNPYMRGLIMKRDLSVREACHIYRNILLFNLDITICGFDNIEEKNDFYEEITDAMNAYIKGNASYGELCDTTYCYDDDGEGGVSIAAHLKLVEYLQKKGVI